MAQYFSITPVSAVVITPVSSGATYQQLVNDLGNTKYEVSGITIQSASLAQLQQPITFSYVDANGEVHTIPVVPVKNMFLKESIPVLYLDLSAYGIIFDANLWMGFNLLPYSDVTLIFDVYKSSYAGMLRSMIKFNCASITELPDIPVDNNVILT